MTKSATDLVQEIINAAVVDAVVALKDASKGLPNALLRDLAAIHANTSARDLPEAVQKSVAESVREAFAKLRREGYVVADAKSVQRPAPPPQTPVPGGPRTGRPRPAGPGPDRRPPAGRRPR
jgi:hypothetical protein